MRRIHHMSITREGLLYLAVMGTILVAAIIRQINLLMLLYGVLAGPLLISWSLVRQTLKKVDVARKCPATVTAGRRFRVDLTVTNNKRRGSSFSVAVRDELKPRGEPNSKIIGAEVYLPYLPAREPKHGSYEGILDRRGLYDFQPLKISTRYPLGLLRTMLRIDRPQRLIVLPRPGRLSPQWQRLWKGEESAIGGSRRTTGMQDGDFYGLREWRAGDSRSRIHWRTTARRQALTVRQFERKRQLTVALVVDLWLPGVPTPEDRRRVEEVISFAATVVTDVCREAGRTLLVEVVGRSPKSVAAPASPLVLEEALKSLALAEPAAADQLPATLGKMFERLRPGANVLVVGPRKPDLNDAERFGEYAGRDDFRSWATRAATLSPDDGLWPQIFQQEPSR